MASKSTWVYLDEAEEIFGGPIPDDADIVSHVCNSDGLTVFTRDSVERAAMAKTDRENHNALIAGHYHTIHGLGVRADYVGAARAVAGNGGGEDGSVSTPPAKSAGFHGRIMNLCPDFTEAKHHDIVYKRGYRDARHAAAEIGLEADAIAERLADLQENADLKDVHWQKVCTAFGFVGHADPEELIARAARLVELEEELKIQKAVNDLAYRPHRILVEQADALRARLTSAEKALALRLEDQELRERGHAARLAEAERERDSAIMAFRLATSLDSLSDEELHQLKANLQDVIDRSADSAPAARPSEVVVTNYGNGDFHVEMHGGGGGGGTGSASDGPGGCGSCGCYWLIENGVRVGQVYCSEHRAAATVTPASAPAIHYPVEFGPSDARRLHCACGNPDPAHADSAPAGPANRTTTAMPRWRRKCECWRRLTAWELPATVACLCGKLIVFNEGDDTRPADSENPYPCGCEGGCVTPISCRSAGKCITPSATGGVK